MLRVLAGSDEAWTPLPALALTPYSLARWARTLMRVDHRGCDAVLVPDQELLAELEMAGEEGDLDRDMPSAGGEDTFPQASVIDGFLHIASPEAVRLATLCAPYQRVSLPLLRLIREELVPEATTSDEAEVIVSGLFTLSPDSSGEAVLRFREDVRAEMKDMISARDAWRLHDALSRRIAKDAAAAQGGFAAVAEDSSGDLTLPAEAKAFAEASLETLRFLKLATDDTARDTVAGTDIVFEAGEVSRDAATDSAVLPEPVELSPDRLSVVRETSTPREKRREEANPAYRAARDQHLPPMEGQLADLEAQLSGVGHVYQAGRDLHVQFQDGRSETSPLVDECPYPGLAAFGPDQARWFFGRDRAVAEIIERLAAKLAEAGPLVMIGSSGSGKTSLLLAGLIPALARGALPIAGSSRWPRLLLTPTANPMHELSSRVSLATGDDASSLAEAWPADPQQYVYKLRDALTGDTDRAGPSSRIILLVDQFEEVFTLCTDTNERQAFIDLLTRIAARPADGMEPVGLVVICVRADFYEACMRYPPLLVALRDSSFPLGPMSAAGLREAIIYPAQAVGLDVEPGLVEVLLRDVGVTGGAGDEFGDWAGRLPLMAHALRATWQQRRGRTLTVEGYRATGGVMHAIATAADRLFDSLDQAAQLVTKALFLRLIKIDDGTGDTRRHVSRRALVEGISDLRVATTVIDMFTQARLLTQDRDTVTITHEALIYAWPRLRAWIDRDRAGNLIRQEVEDAARAWDSRGRDTSYLFSGNRLEEAQAWATSHDNNLSPIAREFLTQSRKRSRRRWPFR